MNIVIHVDVVPLMRSIWTLQKEIRSRHAREFHQTSTDSFFPLQVTYMLKGKHCELEILHSV